RAGEIGMRMPLLSPLPVLRAVDHQPVQPAGKCCLETELPEVAGQLHAGLLGDVFGIGAMPAPFPGEAIDGVVVAIHQFAEGASVAILRAPYQNRDLGVIHAGSSWSVESLDGPSWAFLGSHGQVYARSLESAGPSLARQHFLGSYIHRATQ